KHLVEYRVLVPAGHALQSSQFFVGSDSRPLCSILILHTRAWERKDLLRENRNRVCKALHTGPEGAWSGSPKPCRLPAGCERLLCSPESLEIVPLFLRFRSSLPTTL